MRRLPVIQNAARRDGSVGILPASKHMRAGARSRLKQTHDASLTRSALHKSRDWKRGPKGLESGKD